MKLLIKLGGTLLDSAETRGNLAAQIADLPRQGHAPVVVHGGGKQITRFLEAQGIKSNFIEGLRVSTPEVIDAVLKVVAGTVNHQLVAALNAAGACAVGLSGIDANLADAVPIRAELGAVGKPTQSNPRILDVLTEHAFLPCIACIAGDAQGNIYNVNADQMAVSCAGAFRAAQLLFLTDVDAVRGPLGESLPTLRPSGIKNLIETGVATGGMQAKLNAALEGLSAGIPQVVIANGSTPNILLRLLAGEPLGTRILQEGAA